MVQQIPSGKANSSNTFELPVKYIVHTQFMAASALFLKKLIHWGMDNGWSQILLGNKETLYPGKKLCRLNAVTYKENAQFVQNTIFGVWEKKW